jgi:glycogen debranching enzyme
MSVGGSFRNSGPRGGQLVANAEVEHAAVKSMIHELQQAEADDDQALDEFFEKMMQRVWAHFVAEERDLFLPGPSSLDPSSPNRLPTPDQRTPSCRTCC